jgi:hypothetical protein
MSIHQHKRLTEEDPRHRGVKPVMIVGIGIAALIGLAIVFSV